MLQSESVSVNGGDLAIGLYGAQPFSQEIDVIVKVAALDRVIAPDSCHQEITGQFKRQLLPGLFRECALYPDAHRRQLFLHRQLFQRHEGLFVQRPQEVSRARMD